MKYNAWRVILGVVLVVFGALALLQTFGNLQMEGSWWGIFIGLLFAAAGVGFLVTLFQNTTTNWWAVIPGLTLMGLGALIVVAIFNVQPEEVMPAIFMGSISASFWAVYVMDRDRWWAIIPGGVLASLALLILFSNSSYWPAIILFAGMAVTFGLVAIMNRPDEKPRTWAWYPALAMAVLAVIVATTAGPLPGIIWPIILIGAGLLMVAWTMVARRS